MRITLGASDLNSVVDQLRLMSERRINAAIATALTRTAVQVREVLKSSMMSAIDRPNPYTLSQLKYVAATSNSLAAAVGFGVQAITDIRGAVIRYQDFGSSSTPAGKYMQYSIDGGARRSKRFELALQAKGAMPRGWMAVPGVGARMDAYGNMSRGQIAQIIAQLGTELLSGYDNRPATIRSRIAGQRRAGGQFFAVLPGSRSRLKPGIYQREFMGNNITPILMYVRSATYRKIFDFYGISKTEAERILPLEITRSVNESISRMRAQS